MSNNKKLVALLTNHDDDVYCFRKELIESISEAGYDVLISCPYGEKLNLLKNIKFKFDDVRIDRRGTNILKDFKLIIHYRRMMKKYKPDAILTYTSKPNVYASLVASRMKIPYINNVTGFGSVLNKSGLMKKFIMFLFKTAFRHSSCVFFQNQTNMKLAINEGIIKKNYKLIPGSGVNLKNFKLQPYPEDSKDIIFNYIGRILHDKGIDDYIEAARKIRSKYPNTEFNIIGFIEPTESHYEKELEELEKEDIVIYRGSQKDVKPFIKRSHATIHPSIYGEGMSNVLLESASSGRPIITTDNPGCMETVDDGKSGFIYHGGNVKDLINKIESFLAMGVTERKNMGINGRKKVQQEFSREIVVDSYLEEIKKYIKN